MSPFYMVLSLCFGTALVSLMIIGAVRRSMPVSTPLMAMLIGLAAGPHALGLIDLSQIADDPDALLREAARITLAMSVMATALRLPAFSLPLARAAGIVLALLMPLMWLAGAAISWMMLGLSLPAALALGAVLSPTDPVLASAVVTGDLARENVPARLRHLLSAEAAANDGLALPFVMIPVLIITRTSGDGAVYWLTHVLIWEVGVGAVFGWGIGTVVGRLMKRADRAGMMTNISVLSASVALALSVLAISRLLEADGILGVFIAGLAFSRVIQAREKMQAERVQDSARLLLEIPVFVLFGISLPLSAWSSIWTGTLAFIAAILVLRRLPFIVLVAPLTRFFRNWRERLYVGWFGPVGIAAIFYALLVDERVPRLDLWPVVSLTVAVSILLHGIIATPLTHAMRDVRHA